MRRPRSSFAIWAIRLPRRRLLLGLGGLVVAAILAVGLVAPLRSRVVEKAQALAAGDVNRVLTGRLDGWRAALRMLGRHPALSVGQGAFAKLSPDEYNALWKRNQAYYEKKFGVVWQPHKPREGVTRSESKVGRSDAS